MDLTRDTRSLCMGIWVKTGSRNETSKKFGIAHFLEHMFFKGTDKRSAKDIAVEIDSLGGELNAFTSRENTAFFIKVLDEHIEKAIELLTDIFMNSVFPGNEIRKEKGVISEEIKSVEDTPEDYIHDLFNETAWKDSGLAHPVLGSEDIIATFTEQDLVEYVEDYYGAKNIVVACSGNFEEEGMIEKLNRTIGTMQRISSPAQEPCPEFIPGINIIPKELSAVQLCLGVKGLPQASEDRYCMHLLNTILGAGFSSRLFQEIREKRGFAYSVGSFNVSYLDTGVWTVYTGTDRKHVSEVVEIITDQLKGLPETLTAGELQRAKNQLKGSLILALESTGSKMSNIAKQEIYYGKYFSPEDIIRAVESVTLEDLIELSRRLVRNNDFALTAFGPVKEKELRDSLRSSA